VVRVSEDAEIVRALITVLYPIPSEIPSSYSVVFALLAAAQKYNMPGIQSSIYAEISRRNLLASTGAEAVIYAIASKNKLLPEAQTAARLTLHHPLTFEFLGEGLREFEAWALRDLANFRKSCRDSLISCLESFFDTRGPSKVWKDCSKPSSCSCSSCSSNIYFPSSYSSTKRRDGDPVPALPSWLRSLFEMQIGALKQGFTSPLLKPSSIHGAYLEALQMHIQQKEWCTCLKTHALHGKKYCEDLEQKLVDALDNANSAFTFQGIS
jgi:hypothetical protein